MSECPYCHGSGSGGVDTYENPDGSTRKSFVTCPSCQINTNPRKTTNMYTKGPYKLTALPNSTELIITAYDEEIARVGPYRGYETMATARLLAEAPALLDMLMQAYWMMFTQGKGESAAAKCWKAKIDFIKGGL